MRHAGLDDRPQIEIVDAPTHANKLKADFPYLDIQSILDVEPIGGEIINGLTGKPAQRLEEFEEAEQEQILRDVGDQNWFDLWLIRKVEYHSIEIGDISTPKGFVEAFSDA